MVARRSPSGRSSARQRAAGSLGGAVGFLALMGWSFIADAPSRAQRAAPDDREVAAGRWDVVAVTWEGRPVDPEWLARLQVIYRPDGSWAVLLRRLSIAEGTSTIRQDVSPKQFRMATLGSAGIKPSRFKGIYRLEGDTRTLCIVRDEAELPDDFTAAPMSGRMLVTLRRAQAAKAEPRPPFPSGP